VGLGDSVLRDKFLFSYVSVGELDSSSSSSTPNWLNEVQKEDKKMLTELASLTHSQLMEKIQALQTFAYQLGIEEDAYSLGDN
jgi:hypothetical protein